MTSKKHDSRVITDSKVAANLCYSQMPQWITITITFFNNFQQNEYIYLSFRLGFDTFLGLHALRLGQARGPSVTASISKALSVLYSSGIRE